MIFIQISVVSFYFMVQFDQFLPSNNLFSAFFFAELKVIESLAVR